MRDNIRKRKQDARRAVWGAAVDQRDVEAAKAVPADVLRQLLAGTRLGVGAVAYADDICALAGMLAPRAWLRAERFTDPAERGRYAVRAALKQARAEVARAYAGDESLDAWAESDPGALEELVRDGWQSAAASPWAPRPEAPWEITYRDLCGLTVELSGSVNLETVAREYLEHAKNPCEDCGTLVLRGVAPAGILAHLTREKARSAAYFRARRVAVDALHTGRPYREQVLSWKDTRPARPRNVWSAEALRTAAGRVDRPGRAESHAPPAPEYVTVRNVDPSRPVKTRRITEAERAAYGAGAERTAVPAGEEGIRTAPAPERDRSETTGMVKAFKAPVSPRKKAGTGSTGPTVPGRPTGA